MADPTSWIRAVRSSHERFANLLATLDDDAVQGRSYDTEWSIAQVASHLGSQAEIIGMFLDAGLTGRQAPGPEEFHPIWDRWNAKAPRQQATDSVEANERLVARLEQVSDEDRNRWTLNVFGSDMDFTGLLAMRLGEHAVHTWDVAVALDPAAEVAADAVDLLIDQLPLVAGRAGKAEDSPRTVGVHTTDPERDFVLVTGPDVTLTPGADTAGPRLPAAAFIRLVYGRLDPAHTPAGVADDPTVTSLRTVFPGF